MNRVKGTHRFDREFWSGSLTNVFRNLHDVPLRHLLSKQVLQLVTPASRDSAIAHGLNESASLTRTRVVPWGARSSMTHSLTGRAGTGVSSTKLGGGVSGAPPVSKRLA